MASGAPYLSATAVPPAGDAHPPAPASTTQQHGDGCRRSSVPPLQGERCSSRRGSAITAVAPSTARPTSMGCWRWVSSRMPSSTPRGSILRWGGEDLQVAIADAIYLPLGALVVVIALRAARSARHPSVARAWRLFAAAFVAYALADLAWFLIEVVQGRVVPTPSVADLGYLAFYPLMVLGLLALPREAPGGDRTRLPRPGHRVHGLAGQRVVAGGRACGRVDRERHRGGTRGRRLPGRRPARHVRPGDRHVRTHPERQPGDPGAAGRRPRLQHGGRPDLRTPRPGGHLSHRWLARRRLHHRAGWPWASPDSSRSTPRGRPP